MNAIDAAERPWGIDISVSDAGGGYSLGGTSYNKEDIVVLSAYPYEGADFLGWYEGGNLVSTDEVYFFRAVTNRVLEAHFTPIDWQQAAEDKELLVWDVIKGMNTRQNGVTSNLILPETGPNGSTIVWTSENPAVSSTGVVTRPGYNADSAKGTLTATIAKGTATETVSFAIEVLAKRITFNGLGKLPGNGDLIVLRSLRNGKYVSVSYVPELYTMLANQVELTEANLANCTFEVVYMYGNIYLKACNGLYVTMEGPFNYSRVRPSTPEPEYDGLNALIFELQADGTFKICRHSWLDGIYYVDAGGIYTNGDLISVANPTGDIATFTWQTAILSPPAPTLSGTVTSYAPNTPATIQLTQDGKVIHTAATETTPTYGQSTQPFTIPDVAPGDYTLVVTKPGHTSFTVQHITVGTENIDLTASIGVMTLLCGDINGDNMINDSDLAILWQASNYNKSTADPGVNKLCDLNGDGMINDSDLAILWAAANYNKGAVTVG